MGPWRHLKLDGAYDIQGRKMRGQQVCAIPMGMTSVGLLKRTIIGDFEEERASKRRIHSLSLVILSVRYGIESFEGYFEGKGLMEVVRSRERLRKQTLDRVNVGTRFFALIVRNKQRVIRSK